MKGVHHALFRLVRVDQEPLDLAADAGRLLIRLEHGACLVIVNDERPEMLGGNVDRQIQPSML